MRNHYLKSHRRPQNIHMTALTPFFVKRFCMSRVSGLNFPPHPNEGDSEYKVEEFKGDIEKGDLGIKTPLAKMMLKLRVSLIANFWLWFIYSFIFLSISLFSFFFFFPRQKIEDLEKDIKVLKEIGKFFV